MQVSKKQQRLLAFLQAHPGVWFKRQEIAFSLNRRRLDPQDIAWLEVMAESGVIERHDVPSKAPSGVAATYRFKGADNGTG